MYADVSVFIGQLTHFQRCRRSLRPSKKSAEWQFHGGRRQLRVRSNDEKMQIHHVGVIITETLQILASHRGRNEWVRHLRQALEIKERGTEAFPKWFISCCRWRSSSSYLVWKLELLEHSHALMISLVMKDGIMECQCYGGKYCHSFLTAFMHSASMPSVISPAMHNDIEMNLDN